VYKELPQNQNEYVNLFFSKREDNPDGTQNIVFGNGLKGLAGGGGSREVELSVAAETSITLRDPIRSSRRSMNNDNYYDAPSQVNARDPIQSSRRSMNNDNYYDAPSQVDAVTDALYTAADNLVDFVYRQEERMAEQEERIAFLEQQLSTVASTQRRNQQRMDRRNNSRHRITAAAAARRPPTTTTTRGRRRMTCPRRGLKQFFYIIQDAILRARNVCDGKSFFSCRE
jgi:hypothetical protein